MPSVAYSTYLGISDFCNDVAVTFENATYLYVEMLHLLAYVFVHIRTLKQFMCQIIFSFGVFNPV